MVTEFMVVLNKALFQLTDPNKLVCFWMSKLRIWYGCLFKVDKSCLMSRIDWKGLMVISFGFWLATDIKRTRRIYLSLLLWFQMGDQCLIKLETILAKPFLVTWDLKSLSKTKSEFLHINNNGKKSSNTATQLFTINAYDPENCNPLINTKTKVIPVSISFSSLKFWGLYRLIVSNSSTALEELPPLLSIRRSSDLMNLDINEASSFDISE